MYCIIDGIDGDRSKYFDYDTIINDIMNNPSNYTFEFVDNIDKIADESTDPYDCL